MSLTIIIPCKNEQKNIEKTVNYINKNLKKIIYEIIIINDFSSDNTWKILQKLSKKNYNIKYLNNKNKFFNIIQYANVLFQNFIRKK
jgi:glycosyltransferase involved in cell wall biosynthesis